MDSSEKSGHKSTWVVTDDKLNEFKQDYYKDGKDSFDSEIKHLPTLADGYHKRFKASQTWTDALRAHALYNSLALRDTSHADEWREKAFQVQLDYWNGISGLTFGKQQEISKQLTEKLGTIREMTREKLLRLTAATKAFDGTPISNDLSKTEVFRFAEEIECLSIQCTDDMVKLAHDLIQTSVEILNQKPPCPFVVVAIGSLGRGEATPYSDLEYIFLIQQEDYKIKKYFERLAVTSYFIIGNLQETKLTCMAIPELMHWYDDRIAGGFRIDGLGDKAGNIPTGKGEGLTYILTAEELVSIFKDKLDNPKRDEVLRGDLTAMLTYTRLIYADGRDAQNILNNFNTERSKMVPPPVREKLNKEMLMADIRKYTLDLECLGGNSYIVDPKKQLYRYPSLVLFDISVVCGITERNSWTALSALKTAEKISKSCYTALKILLASACFARLSTYLSNNAYIERTSMLSEAKGLYEDEPKEMSGKVWHMPENFFTTVCSVLLPLQTHFSKVQVTDNVNRILAEDLEQLTWITKFHINYFSGNWKNAIDIFNNHLGHHHSLQPKCEELAMELNRKHEALVCFTQFGWALHNFSEAESHEALQYFDFVKQELGDSTVSASLFIGACIGIANCKKAMDKCEEAIAGFEEALSMFDPKEFSSNTAQDVANSWQRLAHYKLRVGAFLEAESLLEKAMESHLQYSNTNHIDGDSSHRPETLEMSLSVGNLNVAECLELLGIVYWQTGRLEKSELYLSQALIMLRENFGRNTNHETIANASNQLAGLYTEQQKKWQEAWKLSKNAITIYQQMGNNMQLGLVNAMNTNGYCLSHLGHYREAELCIKNAFDILDQMVGTGKPHFLRPYLHHSLGCNHNLQRKYDDAIDSYTEFKRLLQNRNDKDYAEACEHLGTVFVKQGRITEAIKNYKESLHICETIYPPDHEKTVKIRSLLAEVSSKCVV